MRRADGTPLAVPAWMTRPEAAYAKIVSVARLPARVLLELRRVTMVWLSSSAHNVHEEDHDAAAPSKTPTGTFPGTARGSRRTTPTGRARAATPELVQWMKALAKMIREEGDDEQHHR